jgi:hypothetical protein
MSEEQEYGTMSSQPIASAPALSVFVCCAACDWPHYSALVTRLAPLVREGIIFLVSEPLPGEHYDDTAQRLASADIVIALLTPDFFSFSDMIIDFLLNSLQRGTSQTIVPVLVRPCSPEFTAFHQRHLIPSNGKAVTLWPNIDEAWHDVQQRIYNVVLAAHKKSVSSGKAMSSGAAPSAQKDLWMVIEGMHFFAAREGAQVRVVANINGAEFTYPSKAGIEWLEIGPSMSAQVFRLPPTPDRYIIRFHADVRVPAAERSRARATTQERGSSWINGQLKSVNEHIVTVPRDIPYSRAYLLHTFDLVHRARSAGAEAELEYRITFDP